MIRIAVLAVVLAALVASCGVTPSPGPAPIPGERLPSTIASAEREVPRVRARVWGVRDQRLIPVSVPVRDTGVGARIEALLLLSDPEQRPPTAIPSGTTLLSLTQREDVVELMLSSELLRARGADLSLCLGQLVMTVTEHPRAGRLVVRVAGKVVPYIDAGGKQVVRPLTRADFAAVAQPSVEDE